MGMDRSKRVDRAHVGGPRKRGQRRQMVQFDGQSMEAGKPAKRDETGDAQSRRGRSRRAKLRGLPQGQPPPAAKIAGQTESRKLPTQNGQTGMDNQTGQQRTSAAGRSNGRGPRNADGTAQRARTNL